MQRDADWVAASLREEGSAVLLRGLVGGLAAAVVGGLAGGLFSSRVISFFVEELGVATAWRIPRPAPADV